MNKSLVLLCAALWPVAALAQASPKEVSAPSAAAVAPGSPILEHVDFQDVDLPSIITYLKKKNEELGGDQRELNIIVSPGLEKLKVPELSLRNVTVTDVLTVASTVLEVQLEPVVNLTSGENIAWIVKRRDLPSHAGAATGGFGSPDGSGPITSFIPAPGSAAGGATGAQTGVPGSTGPDVLPPAPGPNPAGDVIRFNAAGSGSGAPAVIELATSPPTGGSGFGGMSEPAARPMAKVFGVTSLITSSKSDPDERDKERIVKFDRLIRSLQSLANDEGRKTEVKAYNELEIIVVKSANIEDINLIAETIRALETNAASEHSRKEPEKAGGN